MNQWFQPSCHCITDIFLYWIELVLRWLPNYLPYSCQYCWTDLCCSFRCWNHFSYLKLVINIFVVNFTLSSTTFLVLSFVILDLCCWYWQMLLSDIIFLFYHKVVLQIPKGYFSCSLAFCQFLLFFNSDQTGKSK